MADPRDADRLRRLRAARATGHVDPDLIPWLCDLAGATDPPPSGTPLERFALALSAEIDRWMARRGVTHRSIGCSRRSLARALKGRVVTTATVVDVADSLDCDPVIEFRPRARSHVAPNRPHVAPAPSVAPCEGPR